MFSVYHWPNLALESGGHTEYSISTIIMSHFNSMTNLYEDYLREHCVLAIAILVRSIKYFSYI